MTSKHGIPAGAVAVRASGDAAVIELGNTHARLISVLEDFERGLGLGVSPTDPEAVAKWTLGALVQVYQALRLLREVDSIRDRLREARHAELRMLVESLLSQKE